MSSPVKRSGPVHAAHVRAEVQSLGVRDKTKKLTLAEFWNKLDCSPKEFRDYHLSNNDWNPKEDFGEYMNEISMSILDGFNIGAYQLISSIV